MPLERGIGVCSGHGSNTTCTLLVPNPSDKPIIYTQLILYWQQGVMFWIQAEDLGESKVKMASTSGQHVSIYTLI